MSFFNRVLNQFINVIEWTTPDNVTMVHRFDTQGREIMMGAQLTVRESQVAVFVNEGQLADIYPPGRYELSTENMPIMTVLQSWKYGFNSPFKAEVYFINTMQFTDRKWGTTNPVMMRDAEFGMLRLRAFGAYAVRVTDPQKFLKEVFGTSSMYKIDDIDAYLRNLAVSAVSEAIAKAQIPALDLAMKYSEIGKVTMEALNPQFGEIGLSLTNFIIENISLPPEVEKAMDTRTSMGVVGDLGQYTQFKAAEAMGEAARNPGAAGAGLGVGIGAGQIMAQAMQQATAQPAQPAQPPQVPAVAAPAASAAAKVQCPGCGKSVPEGKFCPECGATLATPKTACVSCGKPLEAGVKFCPECGQPQNLACPNCKKELQPGAKFCPECGTRVG